MGLPPGHGPPAPCRLQVHIGHRRSCEWSHCHVSWSLSLPGPPWALTKASPPITPTPDPAGVAWMCPLLHHRHPRPGCDSMDAFPAPSPPPQTQLGLSGCVPCSTNPTPDPCSITSTPDLVETLWMCPLLHHPHPRPSWDSGCVPCSIIPTPDPAGTLWMSPLLHHSHPRPLLHHSHPRPGCDSMDVSSAPPPPPQTRLGLSGCVPHPLSHPRASWGLLDVSPPVHPPSLNPVGVCWTCPSVAPRPAGAQLQPLAPLQPGSRGRVTVWGHHRGHALPHHPATGTTPTPAPSAAPWTGMGTAHLRPAGPQELEVSPSLSPCLPAAPPALPTAPQPPAL